MLPGNGVRPSLPCNKMKCGRQSQSTGRYASWYSPLKYLEMWYIFFLMPCDLSRVFVSRVQLVHMLQIAYVPRNLLHAICKLHIHIITTVGTQLRLFARVVRDLFRLWFRFGSLMANDTAATTVVQQQQQPRQMRATDQANYLTLWLFARSHESFRFSALVTLMVGFMFAVMSTHKTWCRGCRLHKKLSSCFVVLQWFRFIAYSARMGLQKGHRQSGWNDRTPNAAPWHVKVKNDFRVSDTHIVLIRSDGGPDSNRLLSEWFPFWFE